MKKFIFIDDERQVNHVTWINLPEMSNFSEIHIFRTFNEFSDWITQNIKSIDDVKNLFVSFDHDLFNFVALHKATPLQKKYGIYSDILEEYEMTGRSCQNFLLDYLLDNKLESGFKNDQMFFHSQNVVARENMRVMSRNFEKHYISLHKPAKP